MNKSKTVEEIPVFPKTVSRSVFWKMMALFVPLLIVVGFLTVLITEGFSLHHETISPIHTYGTFTAIMFVIMIVFPLPEIRGRLNDMGKSPWWLLLYLTGIGIIPIVYWLTRPTKLKNNPYR